jgi:hypothetical protein
MVDCMLEQVLKQTQTIVVGTNLFFWNVDEVITVDNQSWISLHAHVMRAWKRIFILFTLQHVVKGGNIDNLTPIIVQALM